MTAINRAIGLTVGLGLAALALPALAQDSIDRGKNGAQLYASDCAICHKSPQGLAKAGGLFGLSNFLREHYTASRESAAAISAYLDQVGRAAPAVQKRQPAPKRNAKGDDKAKPGEKKPDAKGGDTKPTEAKAAEPKPAETKPAETKPAEAKPAEAKPSDAKAGEPSAAPASKSE